MGRSWELSRRTFLRGAGVSLALPMLGAMAPGVARAAAAAPAGSPAASPARMVYLYVPNGVNIFAWTPEGIGRDYRLSPSLKALEPLRDEVSVLSGLNHPNFGGGHGGADIWLTGADVAGTPGVDYRNSISVDQFAAERIGQHTRLPSLELSSSAGTGSPGHSHTLAFDSRGMPVAAESNPRLIFERLFVDDAGGSRAERKRRFAEDRSILDAVSEQARDLNRRLGVEDRRKLDEYYTAVREVERRVGRAEAWMDVPKAEIDPAGLDLDAVNDGRTDRRNYFRVMYDLLLLALQTDTTRVATFQIGREAAGGYFPDLGLSANHHELSHHGGAESMLEGLAKIDAWHLENLRYFLGRLKESEDDGATLLDRTMVMYGSGMNSGEGGSHSPRNLPLLLAGGRALGFRHGQHLDFEDRTPLSNLLVSLLQGAGVEEDAFQDSTGTLTGIT